MILREAETRFVAHLHVRRRGERRDVGPRLDRDVGPPRPRPRPDDVARRDQRHGAARRGAAAARRPGRPAALPRPRPRRRRRRPCHVMRLSFTGEAAFELHHPIDRSVELWRALMDLGARPRDPAARAPGAVRAPAREGPRHRRAWTPSSTRRRAGSGWTGRSGWTSRGSSAGPRWSGPPTLADDRRWLGFTMDGAGAGRGRADLGPAARSSAT